MIITTISHGRTRRDATNLAAHLLKENGQRVRVVAMRGLTPGLSLPEALEDMRRMCAASARAVVGFHHLTLDPARSWTRAKLSESVRRVLTELGAMEHPWVLVEHGEKPRAATEASTTHYHLVVGHVGRSGNALRMSRSFVRLEAIARLIEFETGEPLTPGRHVRAVAAHLRRMGREDVAFVVESGAPASPPRSAMTSTGRQRAARLGLDLPAMRAAVTDAWNADGDLSANLAGSGLFVTPGAKPGVLVVTTADGMVAGALDRLAGVTRSATKKRLEADAMARKKKEKGNDGQKDARRDADAGQARGADLAGRRRGESGHGGDSGSAVAVRRGVGGAGIPRSHRRKARCDDRPVDEALLAVRKRRVRALIDLRRAEVAARARRRNGRTVEGDAARYKAGLWKQLFAEEAPAEIAGDIAFINLADGLVRLSSGGWIRDDGDTLYASGADGRVVAAMVAAARAKAWRSVRLWGDAAFVAEATRQFRAAGIEVCIGDPPPDSCVAPVSPPSSTDAAARITAVFRRRREQAERRLAGLCQPSNRIADLLEAQQREQQADNEWRTAVRRRDDARAERDAAREALAKAGFFKGASARRRLETAQEAVVNLVEEARLAIEAHVQAGEDLADKRRGHNRAETRRRADCIDEVRQLEAEIIFVSTCERVATEQPAVAAQGAEVVEAEARRSPNFDHSTKTDETSTPPKF